MTEGRRRGRPPGSSSPARAAADAAIGATVYQLLCWGYSLRSRAANQGIAEVVGIQARAVLARVDSHAQPLGPDRVEQIFEAWYRRQASGWKTATLPLPRPWLDVQLKPRSGAHGAGLVDRRPNWYPKGRLHLPQGATNEEILNAYAAAKATLPEMAAELLRHNGKWPHGAPIYIGDDGLTEKARDAWGRAPSFLSDDETG